MSPKISVITCMEESKAARSLAKKLADKNTEHGSIILLTEEEYKVLTLKTTYIRLEAREE